MTRFSRRALRGLLLTCWVAGVLVPPAPVWGADEAAVLRLQASGLAQRGRCDEAVDVARAGAALDPENAELARIEGLCLAQLERYEEAIPALERAQQLDPTQPGVALRLGVANFSLGRLEDAERAFADAAGEDPENAELLFYQGLLALRDERAAPAADLLERSVERDRYAIGAAGAYYAGLAWERAEDRERARRALEAAIAADPQSTWADRARQALARLDAGRTQRRWASVTAGMEYDSNAVLRGDGVDLPSEISGDNDWRGVWRLEAGTLLWSHEDWSSGIVAGYQGYAYVDLDEFNLHYPSVSLWLDRRIDDKTLVRVMPSFGYGWRDQEKYIATYGVTGALHRSFDAWGSGRLFVRFDRDNLLFDIDEDGFPPFDDEKVRNRDGNRWIIGYDHRYVLDAKTVFRGGFAHERYDSRGREYSFNGYRPWIGASRDLFWKIVVHADVSYQRRVYRHPSSFQDPPFTLPPDLSNRSRKENDVATELALERRFTDLVSASLRWRYRNNGSNRDVYDYDRHRIGAFVTIAWAD